MSRLVALIDLDGTVADFDKVMTEELNKLCSPDERIYDDVLDWEKPWIKARRRYIKSCPGFWRGLPVIPGGMRVVDLLRSYGFDLMILTKGPENTTSAWTEKVEWAQKHIPDADITITTDKGLSYGKILFDDWPTYIKGWLAHRPRGHVIMTDHPWNQDWYHPQVLRYKEDNLADVESLISKIRTEYLDD